MKDRVREALFNLLGPNVKDKIVVDLFAGTGALALEAISRGADRAILIERHFPTAALIQKNVAALGVEGRAEVVASDAFFWAREASGLGPRPWLVFCSPPYDFYVERHAEMLTLLGDLMRRAPVGSLFAVEADERFNFRELPDADAWDVRAYPPAVVGIHRKGVSPGSTEAAPS